MTEFDAFWPIYLRAHRNRSTRAAHYAGILFGTAMAAAAIAAWNVWPLLAGIGGAFAVTVSSHWLFEGRRPLLVGNPLLAAAADLRMLWLAATGRLLPEFARHGIETEGSRGGAYWRPVGRAVSGIMLAAAAAVLTLELLLWWRSGDWQPISLDAALRHWGVILTEFEPVGARWPDRIDELVLSVPLTLALFAAATSALGLARWLRPAME